MSDLALQGSSANRLTISPAARLRYLRELTIHLTRRQLSLSYRDTLLGWTWPLARQLVQLAVLVFVFSKVLNLGIDDYPAFVFCGLVAWTWFSSGILTATGSILANRQFGLRPGFPTAVLPIVAIGVALFDAVIALPLLLILLAAQDHLSVSALLLPAMFLVQFILMSGLAWFCASLSVFLRDIPNFVAVIVLLGFYVTPVYFDVARVPERFQWVMHVNPAAVIIEADRAALLGTSWPPVPAMIGVGCGSVIVAVLGYLCFGRLSRTFADEL